MQKLRVSFTFMHRQIVGVNIVKDIWIYVEWNFATKGCDWACDLSWTGVVFLLPRHKPKSDCNNVTLQRRREINTHLISLLIDPYFVSV